MEKGASEPESFSLDSPAEVALAEARNYFSAERKTTFLAEQLAQGKEVDPVDLDAAEKLTDTELFKEAFSSTWQNQSQGLIAKTRWANQPHGELAAMSEAVKQSLQVISVGLGMFKLKKGRDLFGFSPEEIANQGFDAGKFEQQAELLRDYFDSQIKY